MVKEIRNTKHLERNGVKAIVASHEDGKSVIRGFEIKENNEGETLGTDLQPNAYAQGQGAVLEDVVASLKSKIQNILDDVKYETRENANGGYVGYSMSKRAAVAYSRGEMPKSK